VNASIIHRDVHQTRETRRPVKRGVVDPFRMVSKDHPLIVGVARSARYRRLRFPATRHHRFGSARTSSTRHDV